MKNPAAIAAQLVDIRNVGAHKSLKLTIHVPVEQAHLVTAAFGWPTMVDPVPIAIARLKQQQEETKTVTEKPAPATPAARAPKSPLVTRAAILSNNPLFWKYLGEKEGKLVGKDGAGMYIREWCKVKSRKDILPGTEAALRLDLLQTDFVCWRDKDQFVEAS